LSHTQNDAVSMNGW